MLFVQLIGPAAFLLIGVGMVIAGAVVPAGSLTDDGYPLGTFLLMFGGGFSLMGLVWGALAYFVLKPVERANAQRQGQRLRLLKQGTRVEARVVSCKCDGYVDAHNHLWTDLELEYELPGSGQRRRSLRWALPQKVLDRARTRRTLTVLVDPAIPNAVELAPEPKTVEYE